MEEGEEIRERGDELLRHFTMVVKFVDQTIGSFCNDEGEQQNKHRFR